MCFAGCARSFTDTPQEQVTITIALDGENPWEHYHEGGEQFLSLLYKACSTGALDGDAVRTTTATISEALHASPATRRVSHLHSGSWINQDYKIWIGHQEDNRGWDLVNQTRSRLAEISATLPSDRAQAAWDELYAAEGSDWFWWYGDDFDTDYKEEFDRLFRTHLQNVWTIAGLTPPDLLNQPISQSPQHAGNRPHDRASRVAEALHRRTRHRLFRVARSRQNQNSAAARRDVES